MNKSIINNNSLAISLLLIFLLSCNSFISAQNIEDLSVVITFENPPSSYNVNKAPLPYNKKFAISMQIDDGNSSIYNYGFPVFEGGQIGSTTYSGMSYSDGCNNLHSFKITSALFIFSGTGTDLHNDPNSGFITWEQLHTLYDNKWGIANHGVNSDASSNPDFINYSIKRNRSYIRKKLYNITPGGVTTKVFINPNGNSDWTQPAFDLNNICAFNENQPSPLGDYGGDVNIPSLNWAENKYNLFRINTGNVNVPDLIDSVYSKSTNGANYWCPIYTHSIYDDYDFNDFVDDFTYIYNKYGSNGSDEILMTTDEEILDYLAIRDATSINSILNGNELSVTFEGNIPTNLLHYALSIIVNSNEIITDISIVGTDKFSTSGTGDTTSLINLNWDGFVVPSAEELATNYTDIAVSTQTEYDALVAMDYVTVLDYGETKNELVNQLCEIQGVTYDDGFCDSGYPNFISITGDTIITTGQETTLTATSYLTNYEWSTGATSQSITVSPQTDTKYWVNATTHNLADVSDTIIVQVSDSYIIDHSPLFIDHTIGDIDSLWVTLKEGATCLWEDESTLNYLLVSPNVSTTYHLDILVSDTIVNQLNFDVYIGNIIDFTYDTVCLGDTTTLINTSFVNDTISSILWDLNGDSQFNDAEGDTVKYVFDNPGNNLVGMRIYFKNDPMEITYNPVPVGDLPKVDFVYENTCLGSTTEFADLSKVEIGTIINWFWRFGDGNTSGTKNPINNYSNTGNYNVMLTTWSSIGCKDSLQKTLRISSGIDITLKINNEIILPNNDTAFFKQGETVSILISNFESYDSVIWFDNSRAESVVIAEEGSFYVTAYKEDCSAEQYFYTAWGNTPIPPTTNDIMNLFTPNSDGFNDVWIVNDPSITHPAKVYIYNRSGQEVFSSSNYQNTWDGTFDGNPLPQATYYYLIEDASDKTFKGAVTIIR